MALRKTITISGESTIQTANGPISAGQSSVNIDAYIKVVSVGGTKDSASAEVSISGNGAKITEHYEFPVNLDGPNFIKQAYEHLKTLDRFSGAEDV